MTVSKSSIKESQTGFSQMHQSSIVTLENGSRRALRKSIVAWLTVSRQASRDRVNPSQSQESNSEKTTPAICGPKRSRPFALLDPDTASWKMCQDSLLPLMGISEPSFKDWPKQGMMRDGQCWEQTMLAHPTGERGCGLWQTPSVEDASRKGSAEAWREWEQKGRTTQCRLRNQVWPTPRAQDGPHGPAREEGVEKKDPDKPITIQGQLNPDWVEWLMGWPVGWTALEPMTELIWLDWNVDPADGEPSPMLPTPCTIDCDHGHQATWSTTGCNLHNYALGKGKQSPKWRTPAQQEPGLRPERLRPIDGGLYKIQGSQREIDDKLQRIVKIASQLVEGFCKMSVDVGSGESWQEAVQSSKGNL